ncbi:MAG: exodeoxyribonuclease VII small subunit [Ruminococcus flavefaciens]|nr:exodeoxyribonuclease VII small subunit [Ruminococcus flavefaciens]MCM1229721.1 exodeoxyribonuclease VII small subunit [Ruminococcus flavefaciens]
MNERETFEESMNKLSAVVKALESGDIPLEKAVELYSEGVKLAGECRKQIDEAKIKITEVQ